MAGFQTTLEVVEMLAADGYEVNVEAGRASLSISCHKAGNRVEILALCDHGKDPGIQLAAWSKAVEEMVLKGRWEAAIQKEAGE